MQNIYEREAKNKRKSWLVVVFFMLFVGAVVYMLMQAGGYGLDTIGLALIMSGLVSFGGYYFSDRIILGLSKAREADKKNDFKFYSVAENLSSVARIPMPKLYVIEDTAMNAFATGRSPEKAVVVATSGLLEELSRTELEGVVAHELSHIRNYDMRLMSVVAVLVGLIALLGDWFLRIGSIGRRSRDREGSSGAVLMMVGIALALLAPLIANLIKLAISRKREFLADAGAAKMTRYPEGLAAALEKIAADKRPLEVANKATAHLYISNPLNNGRGAVNWFAGLFNTHPPVEERIEVLRG